MSAQLDVRSMEIKKKQELFLMRPFSNQKFYSI